MAETPDELSAAERTATRAARNTIVRAAGDIVGKLMTLVLFALLARSVSPSSLGVYVFAFAWCQVASVPIGLGFDRFMVRQIAKDPPAVDRLFWSVMRMKLTRAVGVIALSWIVVCLLHDDWRTRAAVFILTFGLLLDLLTRTVHSVFTGRERGELTATVVVAQRFLNAGLGIGALALGWGVLGVAAAYTVSAAAAAGVALWLLHRHLGLPKVDVRREHRRQLRLNSLPFAAQDVFLALLDKIDAVILSLLAVSAAVGRYGSAYRLLEATFFISSAMTGAFSAMFTYLDRDTDPSVGAVYQRALKLNIVLLMPWAVWFGVLAVPLTRALFGEDLVTAAPALRLLSPVVVLLGAVVISTSLVVSRGNPKTLVRVIFSSVVVNVAVNLALIPLWDERGAAAAMLITYVGYLVLVVRLAVRYVGMIDFRSVLVPPVVAGAVMALVCVALSSLLIPAVVAGGLVYLLVLVAVERVVAPGDFELLRQMIRRRFPLRAARSAQAGG